MLKVPNHHETGIGPLDDRLGGGIPSGSIVALLASPTSQAELLLYQIAAQGQTLYLTIRRSARSVRTAYESTGVVSTEFYVRAVDSDYPLAEAAEYIQQIDQPSVVIVDPMDAIECHDTDSLRKFFVALQTRLDETGSIAILHCLDGTYTPEQRDLTTYMADIVFDLRTSVDGKRVENHLSVPKFRGGPALSDTLELELSERVIVDARCELD